jgi:hypothetical protein
MIRPPILPMESGYEGMGPAFTGDAIGEASRMGSPAGRQAEMANLANAAGFLASPAMMANYVLTGQTPAMQFGIGNQREALGLGPSDAMPQGLMPQGGMSGMFGGLRDFLSGLMSQGGQPAGAPAQQSFSSEMGFSVANDAYQMALSSGADEQAAMNAANTAASLVAQGLDPITAATISAQYAVGAAGPQMPEMPAAAPAAAAPAQTFGLGQGGQIASTPLSGGESMGSYGEGSFTGGGWSPGDVAGAYSDSTGFE